jgi:hypothetical protein
MKGGEQWKLSQQHHEALLKTTVTYDADTFQHLSKHWQPRIVSETKLEFDEKEHYRHFQVGEMEYYVKRNTWKNVEHYQWLEEKYHERVVPSFWRTRIVKVVNGEIICSCSLYAAKGYACRHIWCILCTPPMPNDVFFKHLKSFATYYGENKKYTAYCDELPVSKGPKMLECRIFDTSRAETNVDWFQLTLNNEIPVLRPGTVHEEADYFEEIMTGQDDDGEAENVVVGLGGIQHFGKMSAYAKTCNENTQNKNENYPGNAYTVMKPKFELLTKYVKTRDDFRIVSEAMDRALEELLSKQKINKTKGTMAAMPTLDHRKQDKRKQPAGEIFMSKKRATDK